MRYGFVSVFANLLLLFFQRMFLSVEKADFFHKTVIMDGNTKRN